MLCTLYSNAKILICACTLGSFLILFRAPFHVYHNILFLLVSWLFWMISREWGCHVCAYCIQMQLIIICAQTLGSFLILFRALFFDLIIISIFHLVSSFCQLVLWIFRFLASLVDASSSCYFFCNLWSSI